MVKEKFTRRLRYEGFQYGAGDIIAISEGDALHLYGLVDTEPHSRNLVQKNFGLRKENDFLNVHENQI